MWNHGVRQVVSSTLNFTFGLFCVGPIWDNYSLCDALHFGTFWNIPLMFHFHCSLCFANFTLWNFLETEGENRKPKLKPKPRMNFSTHAKQFVSQE